MAAVYAVRQIQHPLDRQLTAVLLMQLVALHLHQSLEGYGVCLVERTELLCQRVELIEATLVQMGLQKVVSPQVLHLPVGFLPLPQPQPLQCIQQFPRLGGQVQRGAVVIIGVAKIYRKNNFIQAPFLLAAARCHRSYRGLRRVRPSRTDFRSSWPPPARASHPASGSAHRQ